MLDADRPSRRIARIPAAARLSISLAADEGQAPEEAETGAAFVYPTGDDRRPRAQRQR